MTEKVANVRSGVRPSRLACDGPSGARQAIAGRAFDVWRFRLARDYRHGVHAHDLDGVVLAFTGEFRARLGRRELGLSPGQALVLPRGVEHTEFTEVPTDCVIVAPREAGLEQLGRAARGLREPGARSGVTSRAALCELQRELTIDDDLTPTSVDRLVCDMLAAALGGRTRPGHRRPAWLDRAQDLLDRYYTRRNVVGWIAAELGISGEHFVRAFTTRTGITPGRYARHRRLLAGIEHLIDGGIPIAEAAVRAGFADQAHFTRACRTHLRATPGHYRRRFDRTDRR